MSAVRAMFQPSASELDHFFEAGYSALGVELPSMIARAANGADAEPLGGDRVDLAVRVA